PDHHPVAPIRRSVRDNQQLCPGLAEALDSTGPPNVLTNGNAEPNAAKTDGPGEWTRGEDALFVEHPVVRQIDLEVSGNYEAVGQNTVGVVEFAILHPRRADHHGRAAVRRLACKLLHF